MAAVEAFPLSWPDGWRRENGAESSRFDQSGQKAYDFLLKEVERMGGSAIIISTNVPLRQDGKIRQDREPVDPGVAVYFARGKKQMVFACDRYNLLRDNMVSIGKTIEALRGIERWGASSMMERAFSGFNALPSSTGPDWWDVLECLPSAGVETIEAQYRVRVRAAHPDTGGSHEKMARLNMARDRGLAARKAGA